MPRRCAALDLRSSRGVTMPELLMVLLFISFMLTASTVGWKTLSRKSEAQAAARVVQGFLTQARMLSVYRATNHFLVVDPTQKSVAIYEDNGGTKGKFDAGDKFVRGESWPSPVSLALPLLSSSVPDPLGGATSLTTAWSLPLPDTTARWGTTLTGMMVTPTGRIQSAEATPQTIASGAMIFSDNSGQASAVGVRGQFGNVVSYQMLNSTWKDLR